MTNQQLLSKPYLVLVIIVLSLSIIALTAELLPEVKAKMIVIPTLILIIILCIFDLKGQFFVKRE